MVREGEVLWEPQPDAKERSNLAAYLRWLAGQGRKFDGYGDLWNWSVTDVGPFWESIYRYFEVNSSSAYARPIKKADHMMGTRWFEGAKINYAEHVFRNTTSERDALIFKNESGESRSVSWNQLERETSSLAQTLRTMGVEKGDRVAAFIPNTPEAVVALLACASIGAIWSSCSPDFGAASVIDRFKQIEPKVLIAVDKSQYNGKVYDKTPVLHTVRDAMPSLNGTIVISHGDLNTMSDPPAKVINWGEATSGESRLDPSHVPFDHPLWIVYSSGTTGLPKPLVHSHGGILLEHLKVLALHNDVRKVDRLFWFTTTGWMMWNYVVGGLLLGSTVVLYDGSPVYPDKSSLWNFAEETGITLFGTSAAYIGSCMKSEVRPLDTHNLSGLRGLGSTGSPLSADAFEWIYRNVKRDFWVASISGGTDLCTAFVGGCPVLPVTAGELQCRCLGAKVESFNEEGEAVIGETGELVITEPMPSMPIYLWNDADNRRYSESYFEMFPGVWRHGDWIKITRRGTCVIYGRSDATLKKQGVRLGTSDIYRYVESIPSIQDSLVIELEETGGSSRLLLFVVLEGGRVMDSATVESIRGKIRRDVSSRFVPDEIIAIPDVPRTINGKKMEVPIKKILMGIAPEKALDIDSMSNPGSLAYFLEYRAKMHR